MANELKTLITKRVELLAETELANAQHEERMSVLSAEMFEVLEGIADHVESDTPKPAPKKRANPKKPKQPDHDKVAKQYADFEPCPTGCLCGCGEDVAEGASFVRGHQHKLRSIALAVAAGKLSSNKLSDAGKAYAIAQEWMEF